MSTRSSTHSRRLRVTSDPCDSTTTSAHTSYSSKSTTSTNPSSLRSGTSLKRVHNHLDQEDMEGGLDMALSNTYTIQDDPRDSVATYNSVFSDESIYNFDDPQDVDYEPPAPTDDAIPPVLPQYRASIVDPMVRPSTPDAFSRLFPSLDRLSIRHDDLTPDGNMNLRVDTVVPCSGRHPITVQLFHLRMHDLARREFSLRRYCRDSGREVCNSKRAYGVPPPVTRPGFQRSISSAFQSLKYPFRRSSITSTHSHQRRPSTSHSSAASSSWDAASIRSMRMRTDSWSSDRPPPPVSTLVPTNSIKLEFSNYARVDVTRHESKHGTQYGFEWWGHAYAWKRVFDENLASVSYHLIRDGHRLPVAHITPETRSPNQIDADEWAGGWIPPCHLLITDQSIVDAVTDVADVLVATGLVTLVDDCIKNRWNVKKATPHHRLSRAFSGTLDDPSSRPGRALLQGAFNRRHSEQNSRSPLRPSRMVSAY